MAEEVSLWREGLLGCRQMMMWLQELLTWSLNMQPGGSSSSRTMLCMELWSIRNQERITTTKILVCSWFYMSENSYWRLWLRRLRFVMFSLVHWVLLSSIISSLASLFQISYLHLHWMPVRAFFTLLAFTKLPEGWRHFHWMLILALSNRPTETVFKCQHCSILVLDVFAAALFALLPYLSLFSTLLGPLEG